MLRDDLMFITGLTFQHVETEPYPDRSALASGADTQVELSISSGTFFVSHRSSNSALLTEINSVGWCRQAHFDHSACAPAAASDNRIDVYVRRGFRGRRRFSACCWACATFDFDL
jgi:hypothetical protein